MSDLRIRQIEKMKSTVVKAYKALHDLIENEGWTYNWCEYVRSQRKECCLGGAYTLKHRIENSKFDKIPRALSMIANRCELDSNKTMPTLVQLLDSLARNEEAVLGVLEKSEEQYIKDLLA